MSIKVPSFTSGKILVVGDVMLDQYWQGDVLRISPEAPVPVVHVKQLEERVGGAGNVANNIRALGAQVELLGLVGNDTAGDVIETKLREKQIKSCLLRVHDVPTITKLRIIGHQQQMIRLDFEKHFITWEEEPFFKAYLEALSSCNIVVLSDYAKGTLRYSKRMIEYAKKMHKMVLVDPKNKDFSVYRGAHIITPNLTEFEMVVGHCRGEKEIEHKAQKLLQQYSLQALLITRGAHGMSLISTMHPPLHLPAQTSEVYDVTGAGDTVIATLAAFLGSEVDLVDAVKLANIAAGEAVKKLGATAISATELKYAVQKQKPFSEALLDEEQLLQKVNEARAHGEVIVMTNGCFDILHIGHVTYLEQAKALGQKLIVAVNDDASVMRLKGADRPIHTIKERMGVLAALGAVDWVVPFSEDTPARLIQAVSPDILVKGNDYQPHEIAGAEHVLARGGRVETISLVPGISTSSILEKLYKADLLG